MNKFADDVILYIENPKECSNYLTIALISHVSKVMLKILLSKTSTVHEP